MGDVVPEVLEAALEVVVLGVLVDEVDLVDGVAH
jgi:hypothetical protein